MNTPPEYALWLSKAQQALKQGDKESARLLAQRAAQAAPQAEEAWLLLAEIASPRAALAYLHRALKANPQSRRAQALLQRLELRENPPPKPPPAPRGRLWGALLLLGLGMLCLLFAGGLVAQSAVQALRLPATAPPLMEVYAAPPQPTPTPFAPQPPSASSFVLLFATPSTSERRAAAENALSPTPSPPPEEPTLTPLPSSPEPVNPTPTPFVPITPTPGMIWVSIVPDTPTPVNPPPAPAVTASGSGKRWIDVDLSEQRLYAYEGDTLVNSFLVSTGIWRYPTVTGTFKIYVKLRYTDMSGPDYYLPDVPYVMYFYKGYGLHGTYWHNNFGVPMSHGCVNLSIPDAAWLYQWASVGTVVRVHE